MEKAESMGKGKTFFPRKSKVLEIVRGEAYRAEREKNVHNWAHVGQDTLKLGQGLEERK